MTKSNAAEISLRSLSLFAGLLFTVLIILFAGFLRYSWVAERESALLCINVYKFVKLAPYKSLFYIVTCQYMSKLPYKAIKFNQNPYGRIDGRK